MFPILVELLNGVLEEVEIPDECDNPGKIKELLEGLYTEYMFDEESLMGIQSEDKVKALVSFKCYEGKIDYLVLKIGDSLSKMYIESREKLNFSDSDFVMSDLAGYDCCCTKLDLRKCKSLTSLEYIPQGITELNLVECESLTSLEYIPQGITELNLQSCESLTSLEHCPQGITKLYLWYCESITSLEHCPQGITKLDLYHCSSLVNLNGCPQGITKLDLQHCSSLVNLNGCPKEVTEINLMCCISLKNLKGCPQGVTKIDVRGICSIHRKDPYIPQNNIDIIATGWRLYRPRMK